MNLLKKFIIVLLVMTPLLNKAQNSLALDDLIGSSEFILIGNSDFEGETYGDWTTTGTAFGEGPIIPEQLGASGIRGKKLASSMAIGNEAAIGTLTSPVFTIQRKYINFLISGGNWPDQLRIKLIIEGKEEMFDTGNQFETMLWMSWDVLKWTGKQAKIVIEDIDDLAIDRSFFINPERLSMVKLPMAHINIDQIVQSNTNFQYKEKFRPQIHFSPERNWINDPNGLVYSNGQWHLFAQFDPYLVITTGNQSMLHAVSTDLVHWVEDAAVPKPLLCDSLLGQAFTGSGIVDHENQLGLKAGPTAPDVLIVYYLRTRKGLYYAYSDDDGVSWKDYPGNPVVRWDNTEKTLNGNRIDAPKVTRLDNKIWLAPIFDDRDSPITENQDPSVGTLKPKVGVTFIVSDNLKKWVQKQKINLSFGEAECLEAYEAPVYNTLGVITGEKQWVMNMGHDGYALADLEMKPAASLDSTTINFKFGEKNTTVKGSAYCPMTWYNAPDNRRIQITWGNGWPSVLYPGMPFISQMTFPVELKLVDYGEYGRQLTRTPVKEIAGIFSSEAPFYYSSKKFGPDDINPLNSFLSELFDIEADIEPLIGNTEFGFTIASGDSIYSIIYKTSDNTLRLKGFALSENNKESFVSLKKPNASVPKQSIKLRILTDRSFVEAFAGDGRAYYIGTMFPPVFEKKLAVYAKGGSIIIHSLVIRKLKSIH